MNRKTYMTGNKERQPRDPRIDAARHLASRARGFAEGRDTVASVRIAYSDWLAEVDKAAALAKVQP